MTGQLYGYDPDGDAITAQLVSGPSHGIVTLNPDRSFVYMPAASYVGTDTFVYAISDGIEEVRAAVTIEVYNQKPLISYPDFLIAHDTWLVQDLREHVFDPDGDALTFETFLEPAHADTFYLDADGFLMYLPEPGCTGVDSFVFTVMDGVASADVVAFISVVNEHPWAEDDLLAFDPAESGSVFRFHISELLRNDYDPDTPYSSWQLRIVPDSGPGHGDLTFDPESGYFYYLVDPSFEGLDSFSYYLTDGVPATDWSPGVLDHLPDKIGIGIETTYTTSNIAQVTIRVGASQDGFLNGNDDGSANQEPKETIELVFFTFIPEPEVAIAIPGVGEWRRFLGDNRGFTQNPGTETAFRTKQYVKIEFNDNLKNDYHVAQDYVEAGLTAELGDDNTLIRTGRAEPKKNMQVKTFRGGARGNTYVIDIEIFASAKNPLVWYAPSIDYRARLQLSTHNTEEARSARLENWRRHFWVTVDGFPNYEAYIRINGGHWIRIYTHDHGTETPWALFGSAGDYTQKGWGPQWPLSTTGGQ